MFLLFFAVGAISDARYAVHTFHHHQARAAIFRVRERSWLPPARLITPCSRHMPLRPYARCLLMPADGCRQRPALRCPPCALQQRFAERAEAYADGELSDAD